MDTLLPDNPGALHGQSEIPTRQQNNMDSSRIFSLDVLRGIALAGILVVSIWKFGGFSMNEQTRLRLGPHGGNYKLMETVYILVEGKMRAIFSLVFGAGMLLFLSKPVDETQLKKPDSFMRRHLWLMLFGIFNAVVLLWPGDILFHYAIMGILFYPFCRMKPKGLLMAAILVTLIYCGKLYWNYKDDKGSHRKYLAVTEIEKKFAKDSTDRKKKDSIDAIRNKNTLLTVIPKDTAQLGKDALAKAVKKDTLTKKQQEDKSEWEGLVKGLKYDSTADAAENKEMRNSSYGKIWTHLLDRTQGREASWLYRTGIWDISSLMFLGMALLGTGFFSGRFSTKIYLTIGLAALVTGLLLAVLHEYLQNVKLVDYAKYTAGHALPPDFFYPFERLLMAMGYASLLMIVLRWKIFNWLWRSFAAAGRMAFTNYLIQTIICTFIFYGYGMGYFGRLTQVQLYMVAAELFLVQTVFSIVWLRHFTMGPLEWLWRSLICWKKLPLKKNDEAPVEVAVSLT
jgi:uncharacterized protein